MKYEVEKTETINTVSPFERMASALSSGLTIEQVEQMMALQDKFDAKESKKAYVVAMALFKKVPLKITKDKSNKQYNSKYTSIGNLVNSALPAMSECGLSHKWDICQNDESIEVSCVVTHSMGHSESVSMSAPADKSGSKNPIQQIKSTITYLKAATFESIMGLASTDANLDDDGNNSSQEPLDIAIITKVESINNIADLREFYKAARPTIKNLESFDKIITARAKEIENSQCATA